MLNWASLLVCAGVALLAAGNSVADEKPVWKGTVAEVSGPDSSVVVLRRAEAYALYQDDKLFLGDRIFTRSAGFARLVMDGCEIALEPASFIEVTDKVCETLITQLDPAASLGGVPVLVGAIVAETGASLALTPYFATGSWVAAGASALGASRSAAASIID